MSFLAVGGTLIAGSAITGGTIAAGAALAGTAASIYGQKQQEKAAKNATNQQRNLLDNLKYEPIDIEKLKRDATASAIENATQSLALERSLTPNVAAQREATDSAKAELARQVGADLKLGGNLSPDTINRVTQAGRIAGATSGVGSPSTVPLTAGLLGIESINLLNSRRNAANALQGPGPSPVVGLDPGAIASAEVADNAANNQFNIAKAGGDSNLINSEAAARNAQIGGQVGVVSSLANLLGQGIGAYQNRSLYTDPSVQPTPLTQLKSNPNLRGILG